jgi:hypothetical protein
MPRIPDTDEAFIDFARLHIDLWTGGQVPLDISLTEAQLTETESATAAAESAALLAAQARSASKAATAAKRQAIKALEGVFAADVATIDAYAMSTKDPSVYQRAQIDAPKDPSEREAPPRPVVEIPVLLSGGRVRFEFAVTSGGGAQYQIERRDTPVGGPAGPWVRLDTVGEKFYVDEAVPNGLLKAEYRVRAQISTGAASDWSIPAPFDFGTQGSQAGPMATAGSIVPVKATDQKGAG